MPTGNAVHREMKNVVRDKEAKICSIVDATRTLIETAGYDEVTIRDIAASAGVSVGLIYKYFPGASSISLCVSVLGALRAARDEAA